MDAQNFRSLQEAYMEVYYDLDEGTAGDVAARATTLARQRKGQTPERRATYRRLAKLASERENPSPSGRDLNDRSNMTPDFRRRRRGQSDWNIEHDKPGTVTKNPKKLRKQKALGELGEQNDIYDIILSHLLDEGYAETPEAAEVIMVSMSEDWRESIMIDEGFRRFPKKRVGEKIDRMYDDPNIDIVFGNDARRRRMMSTVYTDMEGKAHPRSIAHSPKKSKAASAANRNRPESEKRSKSV